MLNIAMVGGWHVHAKDYAKQAMKSGHCQISAVWDDDEKRGKEWAKELGCDFVADYDQLLKDSSLNGIVISAATNLHAQLLLKAAQAGKHIFTEKVLTFTAKEAEQVRDEVVKSGIHFTISFPHQSLAAVRAAKKTVEEGTLGQITYMRVRNVHNGSIQNWLPEHFYDKEACGGGAMMDLGAHPMYLIHWILGLPETIVSTFTSVTGRGVEDNAVSVMAFRDGAIGVSETGFVSGCDPYSIELSGTKGFLRLQGKEVTCCIDGQWKTISTEGMEAPLPMEYWIESMVQDTPNQCYTIDEAVSLSVLMEGAYQSFEQGKKSII